jgi:hypothetical protein
MAYAIAFLVFAAAFLAPLGVRVWAGFSWFTAWLIGAMVLPTALWIAEILQPSGWGWVILFFWGIPAAVLAALGALLGGLLVRKRGPKPPVATPP